MALLGIKDKTLHVILWSGIIILAATTIYFKFIYQPPDVYQELFLSKISEFDLEHSLQKKAEMMKPDAVNVPILIYHSVRPHSAVELPIQKYYDVSPDSFKRQLQYLKDHNYVIIGLDYLATALKQNIILPKKSVVITLDDGWQNQYTYAFPLLRRFGYTATFFIYTDAINHDDFLTWDQVRVMNNAGMTIGGHTETHPYLLNITDNDTLKEEIIGGKRIIEDQIGQPIDLFAYPYGHYNDEIIGVVKEAGYIAARSTYKGISHTRDTIYKLRGIEATDDMDAFFSDIAY